MPGLFTSETRHATRRFAAAANTGKNKKASPEAGLLGVWR
jgi:hypothetical protein